MTVIHKAVTAEVTDDLTFVLSDETVDRYGDVVMASGWDLATFRKNPIALFGHDNAFPIGRWENVRVEGKRLLGKLVLAAEGTSPRIDELRRLVAQGILKAVSVGFMPLAAEPIEGARTGRRFTRSALFETSLVAVPANPAALAVARSLNVSDETLRMAFGEHAGTGQPGNRGPLGEHAAPLNTPLSGTRMTLADQIRALEADLNTKRERLLDLNTADDMDLDAVEALNGDIAKVERTLTLKRDSERNAGLAAAGPVERIASTERRPFAVAAKKTEPKDFVYRAAVAQVLGFIERRNPADVLRARYGDDVQTMAVFDAVTRAASVPATTTQSGWAAELVQTAVLDFQDSLMPKAVYPALSAIGGRFAFGRNGIVSIPSRSATPSVAGSFVGQGAPIPVRQAGFSAVTLSPKKMAVITTFTREIAEMSTPAIEGVLRQAIQDDTTGAIDTVLLDAGAATAIRPAGLRNGVTVTTAATGGGIAALVADIKALVGALTSATAGNVRSPVWIMNPLQAISISFLQDASGNFAFAAALAQGNLAGFPVIQSATVPAGTLVLVDAADFFSATGDEPRFEVSEQATLHMEDSAPAQIGTAGAPATVAGNVRSMFQTDSLALRMVLPMNWALRRAGTVAWTQAVTW